MFSFKRYVLTLVLFVMLSIVINTSCHSQNANNNVNPDNSSDILLFEAINKKDLEKIKFLLDHGADPNAIDNLGSIPLFSINHLDYRNDKKENYSVAVEIAKLLLDHGADINRKSGYINDKRTTLNATGNTPLIDAITEGNTELIRLLLERGADINARDAVANTPLHQALNSKQYDLAIEFIAKGANIKARNIFGTTILSSLLNEKITKENIQTKNIQLELAKLLFEKGFNFKQTKDQGFENLIYAIESENVPLFVLLIKNGARISMPEAKHQLFHFITRKYNFDDPSKTVEQQLTWAKLLVANGVTVNRNTIKDMGTMGCPSCEVLNYLNKFNPEPFTNQEIEQINKNGKNRQYYHEGDDYIMKINGSGIEIINLKQEPVKTTKKQPPKQTSKKKSR